MAVVIDATSNNGGGVGSTLSWSHTLTTGGRGRFLMVFTALFSNALYNVSSVTYGGENLTYLHRHTIGDGKWEIWYLANPPTGVNTVLITWAGSADKARGGGAVSFTGVNADAPLGTLVSTVGTGSLSVDVTSEIGELVIDHFAQGSTIWIGHTPGAGQTLVMAYSTARADKMSISEEDGAASVTMSWSSTSGNNSGLQAVPLKPLADTRDRLTKYFTNTHDPAGRIIDNQGRDIARSQMEIDEWLRSQGPYFITPSKATTLLLEQDVGYIEAIRYDADGADLDIEVVTETMLENLFRRLGSGA